MNAKGLIVAVLISYATIALTTRVSFLRSLAGL